LGLEFCSRRPIFPALLLRSVRPRLNGLIEPCLPSAADRPPAGPGWIHEIKHDGFRLMARRDSAGVRLLTRRGLDWSRRYPAIADAVNKLRCRSYLLDGEVVMCGEDGVPIFDPLRQKIETVEKMESLPT
jgi:bifunctional non-homologous end joining protein LigD